MPTFHPKRKQRHPTRRARPANPSNDIWKNCLGDAMCLIGLVVLIAIFLAVVAGLMHLTGIGPPS